MDFKFSKNDIEARSGFERLRIWVDQQFTTTKLDWWPLPPVKPYLPKGHAKLTWTVSFLGFNKIKKVAKLLYSMEDA